MAEMLQPKPDTASAACKFGGSDAASGDGVINCRFGDRAATVIQPVREVGMRDLAMLCHFQKLPVVAPQHDPVSSKPSINSLAEDFVARLQATVPSSVSTIIRTACKLQVGFVTSALEDFVVGVQAFVHFGGISAACKHQGGSC